MPALSTLFRMFYHDLLDLVYPQTCQGCNGELALNEESICSHCRLKLPYTDFHLSPADNMLHQVLGGRLPLALGVAYLKFQEHGRVQRLLHRLKYKGQPEIGELLGRWYGALLAQEETFAAIEVVVPVPLHPSKLRERGYNQVTGFASALATALNIPLAENVLAKEKAALTQTKRNRKERWLAMKQLYRIREENAVVGKHVLLVDDVITTGATLETCGQLLLQHGAEKVSIAAIAYTL